MDIDRKVALGPAVATLLTSYSYGIDIQQDYLNGGPTGEPTNGVIVKNITMNNIYGAVTAEAKVGSKLSKESLSRLTFCSGLLYSLWRFIM